MIEEINGWRVHTPNNIATGQYKRGQTEMLAVMTWKDGGYDRLGDMNRIRGGRGMEHIGDRNVMIIKDPEYGYPGFYVLVDVDGKPTSIFLSDNREKTLIAEAAGRAAPRKP